jgi:hypothetical protein
MKRYGRHEETVDIVVQRLISSGLYDSVQRDIQYSHILGNGQIDVLARIGQYHYFYEIKCGNHPRAVKRAINQYHRYRRTHKHKNLEGYIAYQSEGQLKFERLPDS